MKEIGIITFSSWGLKNTFVEGKQAPGPPFNFPEMWNVHGEISLIKDRLNLIVSTIDKLLSKNKKIDLVVFPEMGASLGQYPIELKQSKQGIYKITSTNPLSNILSNFIKELKKRKIGCIIQTMIREKGLVPKYPDFWTYFNSAGIFVDYKGKIYDIHKKSIITGVVRVPNSTGTNDIGKKITDLVPDYNWIDDTKPFYEIPINNQKEKINSIYLVCVEAGSDEILKKAVTACPPDGYALLLLTSYGSYKNEKSCIVNIIDKIQNRTYKHIRKLSEWGKIADPNEKDLASYLSKFSVVMNPKGYVYQSAVSINSVNPNCAIGEIQANFQKLKDYKYPNDLTFWGLSSLV